MTGLKNKGMILRALVYHRSYLPDSLVSRVPVFAGVLYYWFVFSFLKGSMVSCREGVLVSRCRILLKPRSFEIVLLAVKNGSRGKGVGTCLLATFLKQTVCDGCNSGTVVFVRVGRQLSRSKEFYEKNGFQIVGQGGRNYQMMLCSSASF